MSFEETVTAKLGLAQQDMQEFFDVVKAKKSETQEDFDGFCIGLFLGEAGRDDAVAIDPGDASVVASFERGVEWHAKIGVVLLKLLLDYLKGLVESSTIPEWAKQLIQVLIGGIGTGKVR
jgi:hypothetical protein